MDHPADARIPLNHKAKITIMTILTIVGGSMNTDTWTVAAAKAKFSEVIDRAQSSGPQVVTRNGRKSVVIVSAEEWERKTKRVGNLAEFFANSPLRDSAVRVKRSKDGPRKVNL